MKQLVKKHEEKIRFLIIGAWNTLFGYLSFVILYFLFAKFIHYSLVLVLSYILAITNAYICYKFLVFKTKGNYLKEYFRFYVVYALMFLVNMALLPVFVEFFSISPLIAQWIIVFFTVAISYFGHKKFSFVENN